MKTGLLLSAAEVVVCVAVGGMVGGAADVRAACVPIADCATLGYKYTATECPNGIACPFDTTKFFCFEPQICNYTITVATCSSQCKSVGSTSCVKDGVTYYEACGASMCSSDQICSNGTCQRNISGTTFHCCEDRSDYPCSSYYDHCYNSTAHANCSAAVSSYERQGCSPVWQDCGDEAIYNFDYRAIYRCR